MSSESFRHDSHDHFPSFSGLQVDAGDVSFSGVIGGSGPAVLLLHGYPQTHLAWRYIAPRLAHSFTVVAPDLPGYGKSKTGADCPRWTKRRVGDSLVAMMTQLGHEEFAVVGHDRGARVGYRLALDHPSRSTHYAALAVVPTLDAWNGVDMRFGLANFHWFLLAQPFDLPERLLSADPDAFIDAALGNMAGGLDDIDADALTAYRQAFRDPSVRHAMCEDYRAAAHEDLENDAADRAAGTMLQCPVLALWPDSFRGKTSPLDIWRCWASNVRGKALNGGHLLPEERPQEVTAELLPFLARR
ncbi:alpha/beta hydrolase fold [Burkholderia sp. H160]|nr:alpha/beta hydrolase fold [Burkholderia sp. H160]